MMFAVILSVFGAWDLPNAHAQTVWKSAVVSLSIDRPSFGAGDNVIVRVGIANPTGSSIRMLKWFTPLDGLERSLFTVSRNGEPVPYVGKMVKRAAPTEKDYMTLMAGESLTSTVDLSANYNLSVSGIYSVKYKVASADVYAKADRGPSQSTDYMDSNSVELFIEGRVNRTPWDVSPEVVTGTNSFVGCSASQQTSCVSARNTASTYTANAVAYLAAGGGALYTEWFGAYNSSRYATVQSHFNSLRNAVDTANPMTFDCSTCTNASWYAYVYAGSPYRVYLCGAFWNAPATGTDSKPGTLIHETSHFTAVVGTDDYVYGQTGARNLAISNPAQAVMNADNHEYFAESNLNATSTTTSTTTLPTTLPTTTTISTTSTTSIQTTTSLRPTTSTTSIIPTTVLSTTTYTTTSISPASSISVTPAPHISFLNIPANGTVEQTLTVRNLGIGAINISAVTHPSSPFAIRTESCSNIILSQDQSCTITVTFTSATPGFFNSSFSILSNDHHENDRKVGLIASAITINNRSPNRPTIIAPPNGSNNMPTNVNFSWTRSEDPDGNTISYRLYYDTDSSFTANPLILTQSPYEIKKMIYAGIGPSIGLFFALAMIGGRKGRRKIWMLGLILIAISVLFGSCGGGGNNNPTSSNINVTETITGLSPSSTYYWKVIADDGHGGVSESDTYTFQTL